MIRFWVGLRKPSGLESWPTSNDVKNLFQVYGTVEGCQVKLHQNGNLYAIVGMRDCNIPSKEIAAQMNGLVLKGVPVLVQLCKKSEMCSYLANKEDCPLGFACKFAHSETEMKSEAKEAAEIANLKLKVLKERQRNNDLAVVNDNALKLVGKMSFQIDQLTKENELLKGQAAANEAILDRIESISRPSNSLEPQRTATPAESTQRV